MEITSGLFNHMVMQRDARNVSRAEFSGECRASGAVKALVKSRAGALKAFRWRAVGRASGGRLSGTLAGIPAGGPYDVELRIEAADGRALESLKVRDVLVGDVWILAGQSNMQGRAATSAPPKVSARVRAWFMDDEWRVAVEPIHNMDAALDPIHRELCGGALPPKKGITVGPGVFFAKEMLRRTGVPQGLIACAHGGTSMAQWNPRLKHRGGRSLYGAMLRRFRKNGGRVAGVAWYQGESDCKGESTPLYFNRMKAFVRAVRRDLSDARLPFVAVQLGRLLRGPDREEPWNQVQEMQRRLPEAVKRCAVVPAVDLPLGDAIHLDAEGQEQVGLRIAQAMAVLKLGPREGKPPIAFKKCSLVRVPGAAWPKIVVEFDHVMGALRSGSRPNGFSLGTPAPMEALCKTELAGRRVILYPAATRSELEAACLYYGRGLTPYCNITDSAGRPLPVFGPVPLGRLTARTAFVQTCRVSRFFPRAGRLKGLAHPADFSALQFKERTFATWYFDLHGELGPRAEEDPLVWFACRFKCAARMKLELLVGYDGPLKLWVDRREKFYDPNGTNPMYADTRRVPFAAPAGAHEVLAALGSNGGRAWGMCLRFQRLDVTLKRLEKGPEAYSMPELMP